jgi:hypothetical protein
MAASVYWCNYYLPFPGACVSGVRGAVGVFIIALTSKGANFGMPLLVEWKFTLSLDSMTSWSKNLNLATKIAFVKNV